MAAGAWHFDAFISYSHAVDGRLAPALQQGLQTLGKSWRRRRVLHVFRDQTGLNASPGLWPDIERALASSRFFILLASPDAARSFWVCREVSWWMEHQPRERLLIAVTDGLIAWDNRRGDFDWEASSSLPDVVRGCFSQEPLWVDLRWARGKLQVSTRDPRFRDCVADLAAPLHGCPKDDLIGEDIRNHRRAIRLARGAAASLALLAAAAIVAAIIAIGQRNAAQHETLLATSRQLAAQSQANSSSRLDISLLLSHAAWRTAPTPQALSALLQANTASPQLVALTTQQPRIAVLASEPDASVIATGAPDGSVRLWRPADGSEMTRVAAPTSAAISAMSLQGSYLAVGDAAGHVGVYLLSARRWIWPVQRHAGAITAVAVDAADGVVAAASDSSSGRSTLEIASAAAKVPAARFTVADWNGVSGVTALAFDGANRLVVGESIGQLYAFSLKPALRGLGRSGGDYVSVDGTDIGAYSADLSHFGVSGGGLSHAYREATRPGGLRPKSPTGIQFPPTAPNPPLAIAVAPDGQRLAVSGPKEITVLDAVGTGRGNAALATTTLTGLSSPDLLAFADEDRIVGSVGGTVAVWNLRQFSRIAQTFGSPLDRYGETVHKTPTAVSPAGRYASWVEQSSGDPSRYKLDCWDVASLRELRTELLKDSVYSLAYNASGTRLVSAGDGSVQMWQVRDGCPRLQKNVAIPGSNEQFTTAGFRDPRSIVAVGENTVRILDASSGAELDAWRVPNASPSTGSTPVTAAALSPAGDFVAVGLQSGRVEKLNTRTGAVHFLIAPPHAVDSLANVSILAIAWSPDGQDVAVAPGSGDIVVLGPSRQILMKVPSLGTESLQFLHDGRTLISVDAQGAAHVWDVSTGSILSSFPAERFARQTEAVQFPDLGAGTSLTPFGNSKLLVTDPLAYPAIFDLSPSHLLGSACRTAGRQLTRTEIERLSAPAPAHAWTCD